MKKHLLAAALLAAANVVHGGTIVIDDFTLPAFTDGAPVETEGVGELNARRSIRVIEGVDGSTINIEEGMATFALPYGGRTQFALSYQFDPPADLTDGGENLGIAFASPGNSIEIMASVMRSETLTSGVRGDEVDLVTPPARPGDSLLTFDRFPSDDSQVGEINFLIWVADGRPFPTSPSEITIREIRSVVPEPAASVMAGLSVCIAAGFSRKRGKRTLT